MQKEYWSERYAQSRKQLDELQPKSETIKHQIAKLMKSKKQLETQISEMRKECQSCEYELKHPFIAQLHDILLPSIIKIAQSYLLWDYCVNCQKTYPSVLKTCACFSWRDWIQSFMFFGQLAIHHDGNDLKNGVVFNDPRDLALWQYLSNDNTEFDPELKQDSKIFYYLDIQVPGSQITAHICKAYWKFDTKRMYCKAATENECDDAWCCIDPSSTRIHFLQEVRAPRDGEDFIA